MAQLCEEQKGIIFWNLSYWRNFKNWQTGEINCLLEVLYWQVSFMEKDKWRYEGQRDGTSTVKSFVIR